MVREKENTTSYASRNLVFVRLTLPAGEAIVAPPLSAILGQVQINAADFCKQFNLQSSDLYEQGTLLNVHLFRRPEGTFFFTIKSISTSFLLFQAAEEGQCVYLETLFDIFVISLAGSKITITKAKEFFGALRAINFKIFL